MKPTRQPSRRSRRVAPHSAVTAGPGQSRSEAAAGNMVRPTGPSASAEGSTSAPVRDRILQLAAERFFANGFNTITMDDLAAELGMSKKTLYQHFAGKEELLSGVIQRKAAEIRQALQQVTQAPNLRYSDKLRAMVATLVEKIAVIHPVFLHNLKKYSPAHYRQVDQIRRQNFSQVFGAVLEEGQQRGEIRTDVNIPFTVELVLGAFNTMLDADTLQRLQLTPARAMQMSLDLMFDGLLNPKR